MSEERGPQFDAERTPAEGGADDGDLLDRFAKWDVALTGHWSTWMEDTKFYFEFIAGRQWTPEEIAQMEGNEKIPVTFNVTGPVIDAVQGAEISNRQEVQYFPREVDDTGVSDVLTQGAKYVDDECNGDQEDSEAFWDALVCGIGWTETRPEVEGDEVSLVKERVDPLQMKADPASRKRCFEDARYLKREIPMSPDEFEDFKVEIGREDIEGVDGGIGGKRLTVVNPRQRYENGMLGEGPGDTVIVNEWQWWEREEVHLAALPSPDNPGVTKLTKLDHGQLQQALDVDPAIKHTKSMQKVYYRAFATSNELLFKEQMTEGRFRYNAITGKRDRNKGTWFGLVRAMVDPGKFVNKLYSEVLHIVRTNANGGMALEEDAVSDVRQFEKSWAATDKVTWLKPGALSGAHGSKMAPKTPPTIQPALFQMMEFARDMVKACTGVNEEILGLVAREQAGVLEAQRKQAAYGILSAFFDAKRRYQRNQGTLLLAMIRLYIPDDKLVRIVTKGDAQYVSLAKSVEAEKYDIVVDEAPAGPDQKAKVWAILGPLLPQMLEAGLIGAEEIADVIPYLDIPASVANKLADAIRKRAQSQGAPDPTVQAQAQANVVKTQAEAREKDASAQAKQASAFKHVTDAHATHVGLGVDFLRATQPPEAPAGQPPGAAEEAGGGSPPGPSGESVSSPPDGSVPPEGVVE
jgi:hypothetical protein